MSQLQAAEAEEQKIGTHGAATAETAAQATTSNLRQAEEALNSAQQPTGMAQGAAVGGDPPAGR